MKLLITRVFKSWYFPWLVLGIILRLVISAITSHSDLWAIVFSQYFFNFQGVLNIYDFLYRLPPTDPLTLHYGANFFSYPPLTYFFLGILATPFRFLVNQEFITWVIENYPNIYSIPGIYGNLLLFKLPYLIFDLSVAFILASLFEKPGEKKQAFLLWIFNPLSFYTSFMVGQFDIIPVFFIVLALYFARKHKNNVAAFSLGVGGALKMFPLFFLPFLIIVLGKNSKEKIKLFLLGILPFLLSLVPFLASSAFRAVALFSTQSQKMLHMSLPVSGAEGIYVFVFLYLILFFWSLYSRSLLEDLWKYFFVTMLLFFSVTHYHPQWFLWITPFLILFMVKNGLKHLEIPIIMLSCWLVITLFFEPSLNIGLFIPLNFSLANTKSLVDIVSPYYNVFQLKSLVRSLFAAVSAITVFITFYRRRDEEV